ncbi:LysM peptidoglycan-binding domain-containing protein [Arthrobacter sp. zg-Y859]|uniref:LysM peptidoglycan-binding domain-containing protein n=1 Tax=Arthrobacter jinronghuae TaxID=2964609 RepID=A0ABT1NPS1_9MICC|nr:lytic transglycosylase domain-containing protein [Arthrobacter jinronghuae]MCQ1949730.1 LysM peptidoglycan-binding domain-containing protein [Arthrobacter jinronghuae]UWX79882.1 LysM peptidoglycan-binding domain-containing protein [Arthrobacter jinronghuae]
MNAQSTTGTPEARPVATGIPRKLSVAVTTAAIPAVMMSALALAEPAAAAPAAPQNSLFPQLPLQAIKNLNTGAATGVTASQLATQVPATLPAESAVPATHRIVSGDTVSSIAAQYGLSVTELLRVNNLQPTSLIFAGDDLRLGGASASAAPASAAAEGTYTVVSGDTLSAIAGKHGVSLSSILAANGLTLTSVIYPGQSIRIDGQAPAAPTAPTGVEAAPGTGGTYTVAAGDTLSAIAAKHGVSLSGIMASNGLSQTSVIRPGQKITVDGSTVSVTASAPAAAAPTDLVPNTFLHYTYPEHTVADANLNKQTLNSMPVPSRAQMQQIVADTAVQMGVDPALAQAFALQESGFDQRAVSPANAIGTMQVIPSSGEWASQLVGRQLNLLDPYDNATAGVAIISALIRSSDSLENAIASYYQGQYSVTTHGMFADTRNYVSSVLAHRASFQ